MNMTGALTGGLFECRQGLDEAVRDSDMIDRSNNAVASDDVRAALTFEHPTSALTVVAQRTALCLARTGAQAGRPSCRNLLLLAGRNEFCEPGTKVASSNRRRAYAEIVMDLALI
jgi:hypothetical protein